MNGWSTFGVVLILGICFIAVAFMFFWPRSARPESARYAADENAWNALRTEGVRGEGVVLHLSRPPSRLVINGRHAIEMSAVDVRLAYEDASGAMHEAEISAFIESVLLANFATGRRVAILYSKEAPASVAIDRERTLLEIPLSAPR